MLLEFDHIFLKKQLKILSSQTDKWNKDQLERLLVLLKIPEHLHILIMDGPDPILITKISEKLNPNVSDKNFFPFLKLKTVISFLTDQNEQEPSQHSHSPQTNFLMVQEMNIPEQNILALKAKIDGTSETLIISLTCPQITNMLKQSGMQKQAYVVKKYHIDGFSLVCSLTDVQIRRDILNYFDQSEINIMASTSMIFVAHYFRQLRQKELLPFLKKQESNLTDLTLSSTTKQSSSETDSKLIIECCEISKKMSDDEELGQSQMGESVYENSVIEDGFSEVGESDYNVSERGSVYIGDENRGSVDCRMSFRLSVNGRASAMYDDEIISLLRNSSLSLPFDLLNLEPLQTIKIRSMSSPFSRQKLAEHWQFSVKGVKFGRDKDNDLRFPDQMSISSKHARINFKNDVFYLQDLGSKTGTYLRINKCLQLQDQTCVQFPPEVELAFKIIKKTAQQGIIKVEVKKPENFPDYKISLKEGFKIKIGRSEKCHIQINTNSIADKHAEITYKNGSFYFKNSHPSLSSWHRLSPKAVISEPIKLAKGDIFRLSSKKSFYVEEINNETYKIS